MKNFIYILFSTALITSCSSFDEPTYTIKKEKHITGGFLKIQLFDIDKDGDDEIFFLSLPSKKVFNSKIRISDHTGSNILKEYPFDFFVHDFSVCDIDNKGTNYLVVPYTINNQSFVQLIYINPNSMSTEGKIDILITTGQNTFHNTNDTTWDGTVITAGFGDLNSDGALDAILVMDVSYDKGERGIAVIDIKNQKLLWKYSTGTRILYPNLCDIDNDGKLEVFLNSYSPQNGLSLNGTNDSQAYYLVLDNNGKEIFKRPYGAPGGSLENNLFDIDSDGQKEIIQIYNGSFIGAQASSHLRVLEWGETEGDNYKIFPGGLSSYTILHGDEKSNFYFAFIEQNQKQLLKIYNDKFLTHKTVNLNNEYCYIEKTVDLDNDNHQELILIPYGHSERLILDDNFKPLTKIDGLNQFVLCQDFNAAKYKLYAYFNDKSLWQVSLQYNWSRFKQPGIWLGIILPWLLIFILIILIKKYRQRFKRPLVQYHHFDHLNTGIVFIDTNGQLAFINRQARDLLELEVPSLPVKFKIVLEKVPDDLESRLNKSMKQETHTSFEFTLSGGEAVKHLFFNVVTVTNDKNRASGTLITIEDLTRVIHSQRSIAFAALTQYLAHDIKNPLSNVKLILERMKIDSGKLPDKYQTGFNEYLKSIEKDINLVRSVTDSFMQFSNLSKPNLEQTPIHPLLDNIISKRLPVLKDRIRFEKNYIKQDVKLHIDKEQITRAIDNILDNAIRAIEDKGTIIISTRITEYIKGSIGLTDSFFELEIEDTGKGITSNLLDKIFEPLVSHSKGGTGLGLAIVKKILEDHNGSVKIHSKENVGSSLKLSFPLTSDKN